MMRLKLKLATMIGLQIEDGFEIRCRGFADEQEADLLEGSGLL
jgi:hypothetical protein